MSIAKHLVDGIHMQMSSTAPKHITLPKIKKPIERSNQRFGKQLTLAAPSKTTQPIQPLSQPQSTRTSTTTANRPSVRKSTTKQPQQQPDPDQHSGDVDTEGSTNATGEGDLYDSELAKDISLSLTPVQAAELHRVAMRYKMALAMVAMRDLERAMEEDAALAAGNPGMPKAVLEQQIKEEQEGLQNSKQDLIDHLTTCGFSPTSPLFQRILTSTETTPQPKPLDITLPPPKEFSERDLGMRKPSIGAAHGLFPKGNNARHGLIQWDMGKREELELGGEQVEGRKAMVWSDEEEAKLGDDGGTQEQPQEQPFEQNSDLPTDIEPQQQQPFPDQSDLQDPNTESLDTFTTPPTTAPPKQQQQRSILPPIDNRPQTQSTRPTKTPHSNSRTVTPQIFNPTLTTHLKIPGLHGMPQWHHRPVRKRLPSTSLFGLLNPQYHYHIDPNPHPSSTTHQKPPILLLHQTTHHQLEEKLHKMHQTHRHESGGFMYAGFDGRTLTAKTMKELSEQDRYALDVVKHDLELSVSDPNLSQRGSAAAQGFPGGRVRFVGTRGGLGYGALGPHPQQQQQQHHLGAGHHHLPGVVGDGGLTHNPQTGSARDLKCVGHQAFVANHYKVLNRMGK
ncbi:hypothetical protein HDU97_000626 [Phlyctochytrium planicorne]|nr:hypothetical protein HDU97_000626 [Phlyctochytrium planicorne]